MRLVLAAVGRMKSGPERDLVARYVERAAALGRSLGITDFAVREIEESRARRPEDRKTEEARALRALLPVGGRLILLDERGKTLTSDDFARQIGHMRDSSVPCVMLAIGGADGLDPALQAEAGLTLAFGAMTWPHQIVRILAAEQLYRALTILAGHPYHRA